MGSIASAVVFHMRRLSSLSMNVTHNSENTTAENTAGLGSTNMSLTDAHGTEAACDAGNMNTSPTDAHDADGGGRVRQDVGMCFALRREGSATWAQ